MIRVWGRRNSGNIIKVLWCLDEIRQPYMTTLNLALVRTPTETCDENTIVAANDYAGDSWAVLEIHLTTRDYVAGAAFTMGDAAVGNYAYRWFNLPLDRPNLPPSEVQYGRLAERAAFRIQVKRSLA